MSAITERCNLLIAEINERLTNCGDTGLQFALADVNTVGDISCYTTQHGVVNDSKTCTLIGDEDEIYSHLNTVNETLILLGHD